jgi:hypothetical protein
MLIARDKLFHLVAGALVALVMLALLATTRDLVPGFYAHWTIPIAVAYTGLMCGLVKEFADWWDNRTLATAGIFPLHGVEVGDVLATVLGSLAVAVAAAALGLA